MTKSVIEKYMEKNRLNPNMVAVAAGLKGSSLQQQMKVNFDNIKFRTVKLIANVMEQSPEQVFADLYAIAGGINDYDTVTMQGGIYTTNGGVDTVNLHQALKHVQQAIKAGISLTIQGGTETDSITLTVTNGELKFEFGDGTGDDFKAMWLDVLGE